MNHFVAIIVASPFVIFALVLAFVMIAMLFMAEERAAQKDSVPLLSCADIITLLKHFLPQAAVTREEVIEQMRVRHDQRSASIESAYRVQQRKRE